MSSVGVLIVFLAAAGGTAAWKIFERSRVVRGSVGVTGTALGSFGFEVKTCTKLLEAGANSIGVDLHGTDGHGVRLVTDRRETRLWLYANNSMRDAIAIGGGGCSQWDFRYSWEESARMELLGGSADFSCAVGGGKVEGSVSFERCK